MRIVHLVAGAGGMYCGSCLHGHALVAALRRAGRDALLLPMYTPLRTDEEDQSLRRIAFGGLNVYLQQALAVMRRTPWWFDRVLDNPALLRWLARRGGTTRPERLGALCVSMLQGERGHQRKELRKLLRMLETTLRPDLVHFNNALLLGAAGEVRRRLGVPVVCSLTGEDAFLDKLPEPWRSRAWSLLAQRAAECDRLAAMGDYYARTMAQRLRLPRARIDVVPPGIALEGYSREDRPAWADASRTTRPPPPRLGMLARICQDKGAHVAAEALIHLAGRTDLPPVELHLAGYLDRGDREYLEAIRRRMIDAGLAERFVYHGELSRSGKLALLQSLDVFCLPTVYRESKGLPVYEAWAAGLPVVLPDHGVFPEMIAACGGGRLHAPGDAASLAQCVARLIAEPATAAQLGHRGRDAVWREHSDTAMARRWIGLYEELIRRTGRG